MIIDKFTAIRALCPNASFGVMNDEVIWDDEKIEQPTESEINNKINELQADYDSKQYQRDRADAYPDLAEQFDLLWHAIDGGKFNVKSKDTDFYKKLKAVKDANPKPE